VSIVVLLAFANGLLRDLPTASLAAVVIEAAVILCDFGTLRWLWRVRKSEFILCCAALAAVVSLGVLWGIAVAVGLSLGNFVRRAWRPYDAVLGRLGDRHGYHDIERNPGAEEVPSLVIYRFDAPVFFANAEYFARRILGAVDGAARPVHWVLVAAEPVTDIDTTGAEVLTDLLNDLDARGIDLAFAELKGPVRDRLKSYGLYERIGEGMFFPTLGTAVDEFLADTGTTWTDPIRGRRAQKRKPS
jgi:MFS superfamily sulfate permease-like transporter